MKRYCALLLAAACAEAQPVPGPTPTRLVTAPPPRAEPPFEARSWVDQYGNAVECEAAARKLRDRNPQNGWDALRACVEKTRFSRGAFTYLNLLTSGFWDED